MRYRILFVCLCLAACSGGGGSTTVPQEDATEVLTDVADVPMDAPAPDVPDVTVPDLAADAWDFGPADTGPSPCAPGEGCFLDECADGTDCQSGWCVEHMGEGVCTLTCQEECPPGWSCQQAASALPDLVFVCVSNFTHLCRPCSTGNDCTSAVGAEDVCVDYGDEGSFCGGACTADEDCPWGFACDEVQTVAGVTTTQCVAEAGVCPCTSKSITLGLFTPCRRANEWGECQGQRVCAAEGLTDCDAPAPVEESCNGIDDDCDGDTDEPAQVGGDFINLCDDGNPCTQDSCDGEAGCSYVSLDSGECLDGDACTIADHCEAGACIGQAVDCDDDNPCTDDACDGAGGCLHEFNTADCDDEDACSVADRCEEGVCAGVFVNCDCLVDADCAALEDGDVCNGTLVCDDSALPYQCAVAPETVITCPEPEGTDAPCLAPACDPVTGACSFAPAHEGFPCDDGDPCTVGDACQGGTCTPGVAANCNDGNACTDDSCEAGAGCVHAPNTAPCNDGDTCTTSDTCADGACVGGPALTCDDANPCTDDSCDAQSGCTHTPNAAACDDSNACTTGDHCAAGSCVASGPTDCDDANLCTDDSCDPATGCAHAANTLPCSDGNPCTLNDQCVDGACVPGPAPACDDSNPCTDDACDGQGLCVHTPNEAACDDSNACTTGDHCDGGACVFADLVDCDDGDVCTTDQCSPTQGCLYTHNTNPCDDGDLCTVFDQCQQGVCQPGSAVQCGDSNPCTDDSCDPGAGCVFVPNTAVCDDLNACTAGDLCAEGACTPGAPISCEDDNPCTDDACAPQTGCVFTPNADPCDDGDACTTLDACANGACAGGPALDCDDSNPCTDDACDVLAGCQHETVPDGTQCGPTVYWTCVGGTCEECQPDCAGKECGDDGCGGTCGGCGGYAVCNGDTHLCVQDKIYVIVLNNAHQGNLGGLAGADAMCNAEAAAAGINRSFVAFLSTSQRSVADIFTGPQAGAPVYNRNEQLLFGSWNQVFQNYGSFTPQYLYAFDGKLADESTGATPDWADADAWHGTQTNGQPTGEDCNGWTSTGGTGTATEMDSLQLLKQESGHSCSEYLGVLCVSVAP